MAEKENYLILRKWSKQRHVWISFLVLVAAFFLYGISYFFEKGFQTINPATLSAAVGTALLLASLSVLIDSWLKRQLSDRKLVLALKCEDCGIEDIEQRDVERNLKVTPPPEPFKLCREEIICLAPAGDYFVKHHLEKIGRMLDKGKYVGMLILHPDQPGQALETGDDHVPHAVEATIKLCRRLIKEKPERKEFLKVRGFRGHFYFSGILVDRFIVKPLSSSSKKQSVRIQLKANFMTQLKGIILTFNSPSLWADYYEQSCRRLWCASEELI